MAHRQMQTSRVEVWNSIKPAKDYIPGLGRGAQGFTTRSDIGPARFAPTTGAGVRSPTGGRWARTAWPFLSAPCPRSWGTDGACLQHLHARMHATEQTPARRCSTFYAHGIAPPTLALPTPPG